MNLAGASLLGGASSASGLRPASAFVLIGGVLLAAATKATHIAFYADGEQPNRFRAAAAPTTSFDIVDREGVPLAVSVECFELSLSPQAMWRSHTPRYMARKIAEVLGDADPESLLERMLSIPGERAEDGLLVPEEPRALCFDREAAERVREWIASGPFQGFWIARLPERGRWTLAWNPALALSKGERTSHDADFEQRPERWTKFLLDGLVEAIGEAALVEQDPARLESLGKRERRAALRDRVWAELMPARFRVLRSRIDPVVAHELSELLQREAVSSWQMCLADGLDRRYPVRTDGGGSGAERELDAVGRAAENLEQGSHDGPLPGAFRILGSWGMLDEQVADRKAREALAAVTAADTWSPEERRAYFEEQRRELLAERHPRTGLELHVARHLAQEEWKTLLSSGARVYGRQVRHLPRDCRRRWDDRVPDYYDCALDAPEHPRVFTTLDAELQRFVHRELEATLEEQAAAVAMAIVLDVERGDVLAVDGVSAYDTSGFSPILHAFTPGSTVKALIMAMALDGGYVRPEESFATHHETGLVVRDETGRGRLIREALGAPEEPWVSAEVGLARSVNAVLVQIGLRMPSDLIHDRLARLGYGVAPGSGLGNETRGWLPPLEGGEWSRRYTHASISFGHEISVSLWQHAAALATIARGGTYRPLRLIEGIEQDGQRWELPLAGHGGERVFAEHACESVRAMMAGGAEWGTGRNVAGSGDNPEFAYLGTKTGTTEKVETERCLHVELAHNVDHVRDETACSSACMRALVGQRMHQTSRNTCYTSSMWAVGRLDEAFGGGRETMVLLVIDDPAGKSKYGSDVAGPAAMRILRRAVGLNDGAPRPEPLASLAGTAFNHLDAPWAVGESGAWDEPVAATTGDVRAEHGTGPAARTHDPREAREPREPRETGGTRANWRVR